MVFLHQQAQAHGQLIANARSFLRYEAFLMTVHAPGHSASTLWNAADRVRLDRPIFLVGHARAGSTLLATILASHPDIGPKVITARGSDESVGDLLNYSGHFSAAQAFEQKDVWFRHCGGADIFAHMGNELIRDESFAGCVDAPALQAELTSGFHEARFLSKAPTNTFRIRLLAHLFPSARFVALYRQGEEVVGSWGLRPYGFRKSVRWGEVSTRRLGYKRGIDVFTRKWHETITYGESCKSLVPMLRLTYRQLITNTTAVLERLTSFLELDSSLVLPSGISADRTTAWQTVIPWWWRPYLVAHVSDGNRLVDAIDEEWDRT
jgi:hypothetical protein